MTQPSIVFFGTSDFSVTVLSQLAKNFSVKGVVTAPDAPVGRKMALTPSPAKAWALSNQVPVFTPNSLQQNQSLIDDLTALNADAFVVFSYGKIIPQAILDLPEYGAINMHPSSLPKYRGPSPVQAQILAGEEELGLTIMQMNAAMDAGPILKQTTLPMAIGETFQSAIDEVAEAGAALLVETLSQLDQLAPQSQDDSQATYTKIIKKADGFVSTADLATIDPVSLDRMVRAYFPWPNVWTTWHDKVIKLLPNQQMQLQGKTPISYKQFLNGYPDAKDWLR